MATVIAGMTTSLDGFVADRSGSSDRLYPDLAALQGSSYMNALIEETGIESAITQATTAAGDRAVQLVGGVNLIKK